MIKGRVFPTGSGVARGTIFPKLSVVIVIFCMAGVTILRCAFEYAVHMTFFASRVYVRAIQFEGK